MASIGKTDTDESYCQTQKERIHMKRRNSVELRRAMVEHVRVGLDAIEHLPTQNDYIDFIERYKEITSTPDARSLGCKLTDSGSFYVYPTDIYLLFKELHETYHLDITSERLIGLYREYVGQAFVDIEKDRFPLAGA